jgi:isopentenyldiphosphate isomerase
VQFPKRVFEKTFDYRQSPKNMILSTKITVLYKNKTITIIEINSAKVYFSPFVPKTTLLRKNVTRYMDQSPWFIVALA